MNGMDWWEVPRKGWSIIFLEFAVILFLSGWLFSEYLNNPYMQLYVASIAPIVVPVLSVFFGLIAAMTATSLYMRVRRVRKEQDWTSTASRGGQVRRASVPRKRTVPSSTVSKPTEPVSGVPSPKFIITEKKEEPVTANPPAVVPVPVEPKAQTPTAQPVPSPQPEQSNSQPAPSSESAKP